jgi:uncharacterized membrane protein SpoIIM required for sporulation
MQEAAFVKRNKPRWEEFENWVKTNQQVHPDRLADLFIQVTDDLSFARTQYPNSRATHYLNSLAGKIHREIYKNKPEEKSRFAAFWMLEVPQAVYLSRKSILYALVIFLISGAIGMVSVGNDHTFVRLVLGDAYVNMTLENIKSGNPTRVYASWGEVNMFFMITLNNIMVAFKIFVFGVFASIGTGVYLFFNGLMVGTFIMFFYQENQLASALPVIMLHGTIELSSIVIAAGAGFVMGNSLLFPGTYARMASFKIGTKRGLKIVVGLVPFFVAAGFIESFVTRHALMPVGVKMLIIGLSAFLMIYYFVIYPLQLKQHGRI